MKPNLEVIPCGLHQRAYETLANRDVIGFLSFADSLNRLVLVFDNRCLLDELGIYEEALLNAFITVKRNHINFTMPALKSMFYFCNPQKLREAGDPFLGSGPFTLYRGVAGIGHARRVRGLSWTSSLQRAIWFAEWAGERGLDDPAVFQIQVPESCVCAYTNEREEEEFIIVDLPKEVKPRRLRNFSLLRTSEVDNITSSNKGIDLLRHVISQK